MRLTPLACPAALAAVLLAAASADAALFAVPNPATQDRFTGPASDNAQAVANPTFLLSSFEADGQLGGVGVDTNGQVNVPEGAILISPQHYLTSGHFRTNNPSFRGLDGVVRTYATSGFTTLVNDFAPGSPESDLVIGRLDAPIPASQVRPLAIVAPNTNVNELAGLDVFAFGQNNQAGLNRVQSDLITYVGPDQVPAGINPAFVAGFDFDTPANGGTDGRGGDEVGSNGGDSGNAVLADINGELAVVGTNYLIADPTADPNDPMAPFNFDANYFSLPTLAARYLDQITGVLAQDGFAPRVVTVPEPSSAVLLGLGTLSLLGRRRRA